MPSDVMPTILSYIGLMALGFFAVRLISAPYFIWKSQQQEISDLNEKIRLNNSDEINEIRRNIGWIYQSLSGYRSKELLAQIIDRYSLLEESDSLIWHDEQARIARNDFLNRSGRLIYDIRTIISGGQPIENQLERQDTLKELSEITKNLDSYLKVFKP